MKKTTMCSFDTNYAVKINELSRSLKTPSKPKHNKQT